MIAQLTAGATTSVVRMPSLASARCSPVKASEAISSETVNPMPATAPPPSTDTHPTGGRMRAVAELGHQAAAPVIPIGLPTA